MTFNEYGNASSASEPFMLSSVSSRVLTSKREENFHSTSPIDMEQQVFDAIDLQPRRFGYAVEMRNVFYQYGSGQNTVMAVNDVTLRVPSGGIYGLLGPSGCGKTTLLRCLVGRLDPFSGSIEVFGRSPESSGSLLGFMPQEISLYPDFTIQETLLFFGKLFGMSYKNIKERCRFLINFLALPDRHRMVRNLSGGQKRRVSLAVALVHSPPLLILDEPTVGVDPVLRQSIWDHLVLLTKEQNLTVIITTHYIEEARSASLVGLFRSGRMLIESSPDHLLQRFHLSTLEDVFLRLCQIDENQHLSLQAIHSSPLKRRVSDGNGNTITVSNQSAIRSLDERAFHENIVHDDQTFSKSVQKTKALIRKNITRLQRNLPVLLFQFLLPSIEVILFCTCIGRDPSHIPVAIFNDELSSENFYSQWFLNKLSNETIAQIKTNSIEDAVGSVRGGKAWAAITIGSNFSQSLQLRVMLAGSVDNATVDSSNIDVYFDMTNQIIGYHLQRTILYAWKAFSTEVSLSLNQNPAAFEFPVTFETPIYGGNSPSFTEFMAPGVLLSITFLAAVALTALAFVMERKEGLLERSLVAGVTSYEFLVSHVFTQLMVLSVQIVFLLFFTFFVFGIPSKGPYFWVLLLTSMQGVCGMAYGLMISAICKEENSATMFALGSFYPNLLLSGTVWPIQAMPEFMRWIAYVFPQTIPIESLRYILARGWGPSHSEVSLGFIVTGLWTTAFLVAAVVIFQIKK